MPEKNPFESGSRKVIPAVLVYVESGDRILMVSRDAKENDYHAGRYNGLGGKLEADEAPREAASRELAEESGLEIAPEAFKSLGVLQFPNFKAHRHEDWLVFVLTAALPTGQQAWPRGPEGTLTWVKKDELLKLNLWPGDRHFLPYVIAGRPFLGTIWYNGPEVSRHSIEAL